MSFLQFPYLNGRQFPTTRHCTCTYRYKRKEQLRMGFYEIQERWVESQGAVHNEPIRCTRSLLQGCANSMMLLAAPMAVWAKGVTDGGGVMVDVYVDDRIISSVESDPMPSLKRAAERSDELDRVLRLKKHPNKKLQSWCIKMVIHS